MQTTRRQFLGSLGVAAAGGTAIAVGLGGCVGLVSPTVAASKEQAWRCSHCGHLMRSAKDLSTTRCPRCYRKGTLAKISETDLQTYLKRQ